MRRKYFIVIAVMCVLAISFGGKISPLASVSRDLPEIQKAGVLRHLGVPYANFVTGSGDGLDVELMTLFARHLGVRYQFIKTDWKTLFPDLIGHTIRVKGSEVTLLEPAEIKGDVIANGLTMLNWRTKIIDFSVPTFPTQIWLVARADSELRPIEPTGNIEKDIVLVKGLIKGRVVLGKSNTCLEPSLYHLEETGAKVKLFAGGLNELAPAIINGEAEATILDVPDALIALEKWPGRIKIIGPISVFQGMGVGFSKTSPQLKKAFSEFLEKCQKDGTYLKLVKKYYPNVFAYYPDFFKDTSKK
jgi:ABC-type amino acid transport substrate-binding protein